MMPYLLPFMGLIFATILTLSLYIFINHMKTQKQLKNYFSYLLICLLICCSGLLLQIIFSNYLSNVPPIYFDYFVYIGTCFLPVVLLLVGIIFSNTKFKLSKKHLLLFVVPIISLIVLWTNDYHHLFYEFYSTNINECVYGPYIYVHHIYSYACILIGVILLIRYSIKNAGFFSKQAIFISIGVLVPLIINILGSYGIINMSIYITPISFAIAIFFFALAIFKFDFLKVAPIALQRIVDRISDSYIVIDEYNTISDFNQTFLDLFKVKGSDIRNKNIQVLFNNETFEEKTNIILDNIKKAKSTSDTIVLEEDFPSIQKYFHIEINTITNKGTFLGTLILFKDITQHTIDMQTIKDNQDMLVEKERLASLGQMIGGIAHNLKTPIMSIAGATEGLSDLIMEYDSSIEDSEVTYEDHHEIAKDMNEWIEKIRTHLSYMSDIITAIKGQAVAFSEQTASEFTIKELINYVDILMRHELKNALINLNTQADIDISTVVKGNINSLVQVINNIISNAIQAYQSQGKTNENINFRIYKENSNIVFKIEDYAGGLPEKVKDKLFKEMVTTKGKNGTGLGLFMSYSNIKAHFSGKLRYETESGKGTSFFIEIPLI